MLANRALRTHVLVAICLIGVVLHAAPAFTQEVVFRETFDDPALPGWEHSPDAVIMQGKLRISPGNFAVRWGDWGNIVLGFRAQLASGGALDIVYFFRDESRYVLNLTEGAVTLTRVDREETTQLGQADSALIQTGSWLDIELSVDGGTHELSVNGKPVLQSSDPTPLPPGGIGFSAVGESPVDIDSATCTLRASEPRAEPGEGEGEPGATEPTTEPATQPETPAQPTEQSLLRDWFLDANPLELPAFAVNLVLAAVLSFVLSRVYVVWGSSLSNRRRFASNFMLITITTTFIILVVRSSVALSLGLVGALSIIRFRTAIKDPEELAYLFFAIGIGIGLGDNQRLITILAFVAGIILMGVMRLLRRKELDANLYLTVSGEPSGGVHLDDVMDVLERHCSRQRLVRVDETQDAIEASFMVEFRNDAALRAAGQALRDLSPTISITFLDNAGMGL